MQYIKKLCFYYLKNLIIFVLYLCFDLILLIVIFMQRTFSNLVLSFYLANVILSTLLMSMVHYLYTSAQT